MELLAPSGNIESLQLAVENGADAVYLGLQQFNARLKADNFTLDNLKKWVDYVHFFSCKIYLAVNILLNDKEVLQAADMIIKAWELGIDAVIVQDIGLISILKHTIPDIILHFSTQMGVHNLQGAKFCEKMGAKRIILSREALLQDIIEIKKNTSLEVEVFVHGALCVSFSGNCYYSALVGNASGNRGQCLQFCRKVYRNSFDGKTGYYLSSRDLCMIEKLHELKSVGVDSIKIEGRLKRPEYTAQVVRLYRKYLDGLKHGDISGLGCGCPDEIKSNDMDKIVCAGLDELQHCDNVVVNNGKLVNNNRISANLQNTEIKKDIIDLKKVFNRGDFCEGYIFSGLKQHDIIYPEIQGHKGVCVGKIIKKMGFGKYLVECAHSINPSDGFKILRNSGGEIKETGGAIGCDFKANGHNAFVFSTLGNYQNGDILALTTDYAANQKLSVLKRKREVSFDIELKKHERVKINVFCDNYSVTFESGFLVDEAKSMPITKENVAACFSKLNDTLFVLKDISVKCDTDIFIPKSQINALRRDALEKMYNHICKIDRKMSLETKALSDISHKMLHENKSKTQVAAVDEKIPGRIIAASGEYGKLNRKDNAAILSKSKTLNKNYTDNSLTGRIAVVSDDFGLFDKIHNADIFIYNCKDYNVLPVCGNEKVYLNFPVIANAFDLELLCSKLQIIKTYAGIVANNIYALEFAAKNSMSIILGHGLNVYNNYSVIAVADGMSVKIDAVIKSIETDETIEGGFEYVFGNFPLMTLAHCPVRVIKNCSCEKCGYTEGLSYIDDHNKSLQIRKVKLKKCQFQLLDGSGIKKHVRENVNKLYDFTGFDSKNALAALDCLQVKT